MLYNWFRTFSESCFDCRSGIVLLWHISVTLEEYMTLHEYWKWLKFSLGLGRVKRVLMYRWIKIFDSAIRKRENVQIFLLKNVTLEYQYIYLQCLNFDPLFFSKFTFTNYFVLSIFESISIFCQLIINHKI